MFVKSDSKVLILGSTGLVGSAMKRFLESNRFQNVLSVNSKDVDLVDFANTESLISSFKPDLVVLGAARIGGIAFNRNNPLDILTLNTRIQLNVIESSLRNRVPSLITFGSTAMYPEQISQPMKESDIGSGVIQHDLKPFGTSKILILELLRGIARDQNFNYKMLISANLFGPNDNFHSTNSHALQGMMAKIEDAKLKNEASVTLWGDGSPQRELLHVDDLVRAVLFIMESWIDEPAVNVGSGVELCISQIAALIKEIMNYPGQIVWESPDTNSVSRRLLDSSKIRQTGWSPRINLENQLASYIASYRDGILERRYS